tara:strand:+ start:416 stop:802 length:387 start_codon:yes stop_codon:yes gene_type:complete
MSLNYEKVWEVMNDLDEVVQKTKIISEMCNKLRKTVYDWTDADEVLDEVDALKGFSSYILQELDNASIRAWNNTVIPLNPNREKIRLGKDLDSLDNVKIDTDKFKIDLSQFAKGSHRNYNIRSEDMKG